MTEELEFKYSSGDIVRFKSDQQGIDEDCRIDSKYTLGGYIRYDIQLLEDGRILHDIPEHLLFPVETPNPELSPREWLLQEALAVVTKSRTQQYAPPDRDFDNIAKLWTILFGHQFSATDVSKALICVKLSRLMHTPDHTDSWVDIAGYAACGYEVSEGLNSKLTN